MDQLRIRGGRRLAGEIVISGAKNAALPEMCAALLTAERVELQNVPSLNDVTTMARLLKTLGVGLEMGERGDRLLTLRADKVTSHEAPYELVKTMRASILVLGPLLARFGEARVSLPGGCAIGTRPVDQHIKGLQAMGAEIVVEHAAQEPEVGDRAEMLIAMGARIEGHGTSRIRVVGVDRLHGVAHRIVSDRIEAGTFLCAVAAAGGDAVLRHARGEHLEAVIDKL